MTHNGDVTNPLLSCQPCAPPACLFKQACCHCNWQLVIGGGGRVCPTTHLVSIGGKSPKTGEPRHPPGDWQAYILNTFLSAVNEDTFHTHFSKLFLGWLRQAMPGSRSRGTISNSAMPLLGRTEVILPLFRGNTIVNYPCSKETL